MRTVIPNRSVGLPPTRAGDRGDLVPDKLVKYVPAETLALFIPGVQLANGKGNGAMWALVIAAAVITMLYLALVGLRAKEKDRPRWHYYPLALLPFFAWAIGTSEPVAALVGLEAVWAGLVLLIAVPLIPGLDELGDLMANRRESREA